MKAWTKTKPATIERLRNGEYAVSLNPVPCKATRNNKSLNGFESDRLDFSIHQLSSSHVIKAFIEAKCSITEELALCNAYNASKAGIKEDFAKETEYLDFLLCRENIKVQVKKALDDYQDTINMELTNLQNTENHG